jgi:long-chain acyl-CoA synthetase
MAMICGVDSVRTLTDLERDAVKMAEELASRGISRSDRVLLKAGNSVGYLTALLALMHVGASIALVDDQEKAESTGRLMDRAGIVLCVTDDDAELPEDTDVARVTLYELALASALRAPAATLDIERWRELPDGLLMWSSGSTGQPKAIVKSGGSFLDNLWRNIEQVGHVESDVLAPLLPFSHQYGLSMLLIAWLVRCSLVVGPYRRLDRALKMADLCGATVFDATPAMYRSMMNIARKRPPARTVLDRARMLCVGAAPLIPGLVEEYVAEFGKPLLDSYGSTEMGNVSFATMDNPVATGRPVRGVDVKIVDDEGIDVAVGDVGEILVRTPDIMAGYLDEYGQVEPVLDEWFRSSDFGSLDSDGNLHVLGRKRAVHRGGYTLYPDMIEQRVAENGCLAKIVAVPSERYESQLVAFVEDWQNREPAFWRERMAEVLPAYEMPGRVIVVDAFPLNRNGKPDSKRLEELAVTA